MDPSQPNGPPSLMTQQLSSDFGNTLTSNSQQHRRALLANQVLFNLSQNSSTNSNDHLLGGNGNASTTNTAAAAALNATTNHSALLANQAALLTNLPNSSEAQQRLEERLAGMRALLNLTAPSSATTTAELNSSLGGMTGGSLLSSLPTASEQQQRFNNHAALLNFSDRAEQQVLTDSYRAMLDINSFSNGMGGNIGVNAGAAAAGAGVMNGVLSSSIGPLQRRLGSLGGSSSLNLSQASTGPVSLLNLQNHVAASTAAPTAQLSGTQRRGSGVSRAGVSGFPQDIRLPSNVSEDPSEPIKPNSTKRRTRFLVFIKILLKCLEKANQKKLQLQAKAIVSECTRRNRMGDPNFMPLQDAIEERLRGMVGDVHWTRANECLEYYIAKMQTTKQQQQQTLRTPV